MALMFIDGLVQEVENGDPLIRKDIPNVNVETSQENYREAMKTYTWAVAVKQLRHVTGYQNLIEYAEENERLCAEAERNYLGHDESKIKNLRQERRDWKVKLDFLRNIVDEAALVPRPILQVPQP